MAMNDKREVCYRLYEHFISNFYQYDTSVNKSASSKNTLTTFLIEIHKKIPLHSVGVEYLYNYLIYQFDYWKDKKVKFGDRITLIKVFGKKSLQRYFEISDQFSWYNAELTLSKEYGINRSIIHELTTVNKVKDYSKINQVEEIEKKRFYNKEVGLGHCVENTTLFNHRSSACVGCRYKNICKKTLKNMYIGIYSSRGYVR